MRERPEPTRARRTAGKGVPRTAERSPPRARTTQRRRGELRPRSQSKRISQVMTAPTTSVQPHKLDEEVRLNVETPATLSHAAARVLARILVAAARTDLATSPHPDDAVPS